MTAPTRSPESAGPSERALALREKLIRNVNEVALTRETREPLYDSHGARLGPGTAAVKLGAAFDIVPPGKRSCPYHLHHAQEEMFIVIEGEGTLRVAGEHVPIRAGDVMFIPAGPEYPHQILNTSDRPLKYLSVSTREQPEIVEYPDSAKILTSGRDMRLMQRRGEDLDYWDGER